VEVLGEADAELAEAFVVLGVAFDVVLGRLEVSDAERVDEQRGAWLES
jgi:hypothetical protein